MTVRVAHTSTTSFGPAWTPAEDEALRAAYSSGGIRAACAALPKRGEHAIYHRANRLGLSRRRRWTADELERLRAQWGLESLDAIARALGRTRLTVYWQAQRLGLPLGCDEDHEYLSAAAARCGYDTIQLRRILKWAGVPVLSAYSRKRRGRTHLVDPYEVDDAVARWLRTETVEAAARRVGTTGCVLLKWLRKAGVEPQRAPGWKPGTRENKRHMRVESAEVDRVIRERAEARERSESVGAIARRLGLTTRTLTKWLEESGLERPAHHWRVEPEVAMAIVRERAKRVTCRARGPHLAASRPTQTREAAA